MRASVWVALRSMVIGVLMVGMTVPLALAGRRHGCSPCYSAPSCSPCYSVPNCYSYGDCSSYVVGGGYYAPVTNCPNCIAPTHPDDSVVDGQPGVKYAPPAPAGGAGAGGPMNDAPPAPNDNNNLRPAPAPMDEEPAPPAPRPAPPAPMPEVVPPKPEAVPPKPEADDPFAPGAAAPKPDNDAAAPAVLEDAPEMKEEKVPAAPAAPADDDPFKISTDGRLAARVWTDDTGEHRVFAGLVEIQDGKVRLLKESGRTTTVPFSRLSAEDRAYVRGAQTKFGKGQIGQVAAR